MEELVHRPRSSLSQKDQMLRPQNIYNEIPAPKADATRLAIRAKISDLVSNAELLFRHAEEELGFALLLQVLKIDSKHVGALKQLARFHSTHERWFEASRVMEAVLKQDYSFENLALLAEKYYFLGNDTTALAKYEEALSILIEPSPYLFDVYKNLGNIYCRSGDFQAAEENYCRAFTIEPQSDVLLVNLGTLEIQRSDYEKALVKFRLALEVNPQNDKAWVGLGIVHDKMGDFDLAVANIENAIDLAPGNRTAVHVLASWATRMNKEEAAIAGLQRYLSEVQQDEEMSLALIHLFCLTAKFDLARLEMERVLLWNPFQADVLKLAQEIPRLTCQ